MSKDDSNYVSPRLVSKLFGNEHLVLQIVENVANRHVESRKRSEYYLRLRTISKTFNSACLSAIRKKHRHLRIYTEEFTDSKTENREISMMGINQQYFNHKNTVDCFRFLRNVANIQIESVKFSHVTNFSFHKDLMEILIETNKIPVRKIIGDQEFCYLMDSESECLLCRRYVSQCKSYGPITMDLIKNGFESPHHFDILRISDQLLDEIAIKSLSSRSNKEECFKMMKTFINPIIHCDCLYIILSNKTNNYSVIEEMKPLPREVIEEITRIWNVKKLYIQFLTSNRNNGKNEFEKWASKNFFTEIHFNSDTQFENIHYSKVKYESVTVDLSDSGIMFTDEDSYLNVFSNLRRHFPADEIWFYGPSSSSGSYLCFEHALFNILNNAWKDCPENDNTKIFVELNNSSSGEYECMVPITRWEVVGNDYPAVNGNSINRFQCIPASLKVSEIFEKWFNELIKDECFDVTHRTFYLKNPLSNRKLYFGYGIDDQEYKYFKEEWAKTSFQNMIISYF